MKSNTKLSNVDNFKDGAWCNIIKISMLKAPIILSTEKCMVQATEIGNLKLLMLLTLIYLLFYLI